MKPRVHPETSMQLNGREKKGVTVQVQLCRSFEGDSYVQGPGPPAAAVRRKPASSQPAQVSQKPMKLAAASKPPGHRAITGKAGIRSLKPQPIVVTIKEVQAVEEGKRSGGEEEDSGPKSPSVGSHSAVCEAGKQANLLLHQKKMLENLVSELQGKLRNAEVRKPLKQSGKDITRSHPYFQALKSLTSSCHRYLLAESPYVQSVHDVAVGFSYQSLLMSLDLARVCIGDSGKSQPRPYSKTESHHSSVCDLSADNSDSILLRKRLLQYQSDKAPGRENWPKKTPERPAVPPLFDKVTASVSSTFTQIETTLATTHDKLSSLQSKLSSVRNTPRDTCDSESRDLCYHLMTEIKKQQEDLHAAHFSYTKQLEELREEHGKEILKMREESEAGEGRLRSLQRETNVAMEETKAKSEEIAVLSGEVSKLTCESASKSRQIQALLGSTQELESHVKEAKDSEHVALWENRSLGKKVKTLEADVASARASASRVLDMLHKTELRNDRTGMLLSDLESAIARDSCIVVPSRRAQRAADAAGELFTETVCFDFDSLANADQMTELQRMLFEDFQSQILRIDAHTESLRGDCSLLHHENSALLMDNSQLMHKCEAAHSCSCVFTRVFPQDLLQELGQDLAAIRGKWEQELELEKRLRLEISLLQEENWTLKMSLKDVLQRSDLGSSPSYSSEVSNQPAKPELAPGSWTVDIRLATDIAEFQSSNRPNSSRCPTALQEIADFEQRMRSSIQPQPTTPTQRPKDPLNFSRPPSPFNLSESDSSALGRVLTENSLDEPLPDDEVIATREGGEGKSGGDKDVSKEKETNRRERIAREIEELVRMQFPGETELVQLVKRLVGGEKRGEDGVRSPPESLDPVTQSPIRGPFEGGLVSPCEEKTKRRSSQDMMVRCSVESGGAPAYYNTQLRSAILQLLSSTPRRPHLFSPSEAESAVSALYSYCQLSAKEIEAVERARDVAAGEL